MKEWLDTKANQAREQERHLQSQNEAVLNCQNEIDRLNTQIYQMKSEYDEQSADC